MSSLRFAEMDELWARDLKSFLDDSLNQTVSTSRFERMRVSQAEYALAADYYLDLALLNYALGEPIVSVRAGIKQAAASLADVFRLRGAEISASVPLINPSGQPDLSLTNSRRGLLAMYLTLVCRDLELASNIASMVGDPPNATYIGPNSEVCTKYDQDLAYSLKALLLGQQVVSAFHAEGVLMASVPLLQEQALCIKSMALSEAALIVSNLVQLIAVHERIAKERSNAHEPRWFLCLAGLGVAGLAIEKGLIQENELPIGNRYFPYELLQSTTL